jgi:8-oxo-dGTP pyrophosphatase MutT (NUDIX family)
MYIQEMCDAFLDAYRSVIQSGEPRDVEFHTASLAFETLKIMVHSYTVEEMVPGFLVWMAQMIRDHQGVGQPEKEHRVQFTLVDFASAFNRLSKMVVSGGGKRRGGAGIIAFRLKDGADDEVKSNGGRLPLNFVEVYLVMDNTMGQFQLPAGRCDEGEDAKTCAKREFEEETESQFPEAGLVSWYKHGNFDVFLTVAEDLREGRINTSETCMVRYLDLTSILRGEEDVRYVSVVTLADVHSFLQAECTHSERKTGCACGWHNLRAGLGAIRTIRETLGNAELLPVELDSGEK